MAALVLALAFALGPAPGRAAAAVTFAAPVALTAGSDPQSIAVGDFDRNGDPDLAVPNADSGNVSVLLGGSGGAFTPVPVPAPAGTRPFGTAVGDFNGDADPDLVVLNSGATPGAGDISVVVGGPGNSFTAAGTIARSADSVAIGDFNLDGDPDLVFTSSGRTYVSVGGAGASFSNPTAVSDGGTRSVRVADFNGDGDPDLAQLAGSRSVSLVLGGAGASFSDGAAVTVASDNSFGLTSLAVGDFDRDGRPDAAAGHRLSGVPDAVEVVRGLPGGDLSAPSRHAIAMNANPVALDIGDFDDDGDLDLVSANNSPDGGWSVLLGTEGAGFSRATQATQAPDLPQHVAVGDFDQDEASDLAIVDAQGGPKVAVNTTAAAALGPAPADIAFGDQQFGAIGPVRTLTLSNSGGRGLRVTSVQSDGAHPGDYVIAADRCTGTAIRAGASCDIELRFGPAGAGPRPARLRVATSAPGSPHEFTLSGSGVAPPQPVVVPGPGVRRLVVVLLEGLLNSRPGARLRVGYVATIDARVTLAVMKGTRQLARVTRRARPGRNVLTWNGRASVARGRPRSVRRALRPGRYTLRLTATGADGQTATDTARLRVVRRRSR